jgi:hypothetical protein
MKRLVVLFLILASFKAYSQSFSPSVEHFLLSHEIVDPTPSDVLISDFKPRAQQTFFEKRGRGIGITLYHMATITAGSLGDGFNDDGQKVAGHALKALEVAMLASGPFIWDVQRNEALPYLAEYVGLRIVLYDLPYNLKRGLDPLYVGESSVYGKVMTGVPNHGRIWIKGVIFVATISIPIKYF